jgi:GPN-loop GTPase
MIYFLTLQVRQVLINKGVSASFITLSLAVDVRELINLETVMEELNLGPNGGMVYCMETLLERSDWLEEKLDSLGTYNPQPFIS